MSSISLSTRGCNQLSCSPNGPRALFSCHNTCVPVPDPVTSHAHDFPVVHGLVHFGQCPMHTSHARTALRQASKHTLVGDLLVPSHLHCDANLFYCPITDDARPTEPASSSAHVSKNTSWDGDISVRCQCIASHYVPWHIQNPRILLPSLTVLHSSDHIQRSTEQLSLILMPQPDWYGQQAVERWCFSVLIATCLWGSRT